jgi:hypothetical protein
MIRQNDFINELVRGPRLLIRPSLLIEVLIKKSIFKSLADNRLGETENSILELCAMLENNCILKKLNLSGNVFIDKDAQTILSSIDVRKY